MGTAPVTMKEIFLVWQNFCNFEILVCSVIRCGDLACVILPVFYFNHTFFIFA